MFKIEDLLTRHSFKEQQEIVRFLTKVLTEEFNPEEELSKLPNNLKETVAEISMHMIERQFQKREQEEKQERIDKVKDKALELVPRLLIQYPNLSEVEISRKAFKIAEAMNDL